MAAIVSKRFRSPLHWTLAQRIDHYANKSGGPDACWPWTGAINSDGYGHMKWKDIVHSAHRLAWEVANGPLPAGMSVCHRCDNPPCVNPAHLRTGSHTDNMRDMAAKGRQRSGERRGAANGQAKLTEEQVRAIRAMRATGALYKEIAARFGIHKVTARDVVVRRWRHIPSLPVGK